MVRAGSPERIEALNAALWTYNDRAFLPHGSARDGFADEQPVWLTTEEENPNQARVLVLTDGAVAQSVAPWTMVLEVFDGQDENAVAAARTRWTAYKAAGHTLAYWKQSPAGHWEKAS